MGHGRNTSELCKPRKSTVRGTEVQVLVDVNLHHASQQAAGQTLQHTHVKYGGAWI
jgi:hypothetical protein